MIVGAEIVRAVNKIKTVEWLQSFINKKVDFRSSFYNVFIVGVVALFVLEVFCKIFAWITCKESWWWWGHKCDKSMSLYKVRFLINVLN